MNLLRTTLAKRLFWLAPICLLTACPADVTAPVPLDDPAVLSGKWQGTLTNSVRVNGAAELGAQVYVLSRYDNATLLRRYDSASGALTGEQLLAPTKDAYGDLAAHAGALWLTRKHELWQIDAETMQPAAEPRQWPEADDLHLSDDGSTLFTRTSSQAGTQWARYDTLTGAPLPTAAKGENLSFTGDAEWAVNYASAAAIQWATGRSVPLPAPDERCGDTLTYDIAAASADRLVVTARNTQAKVWLLDAQSGAVLSEWKGAFSSSHCNLSVKVKPLSDGTFGIQENWEGQLESGAQNQMYRLEVRGDKLRLLGTVAGGGQLLTVGSLQTVERPIPKQLEHTFASVGNRPSDITLNAWNGTAVNFQKAADATLTLETEARYVDKRRADVTGRAEFMNQSWTVSGQLMADMDTPLLRPQLRWVSHELEADLTLSRTDAAGQKQTLKLRGVNVVTDGHDSSGSPSTGSYNQSYFFNLFASEDNVFSGVLERR